MSGGGGGSDRRLGSDGLGLALALALGSMASVQDPRQDPAPDAGLVGGVYGTGRDGVIGRRPQWLGGDGLVELLARRVSRQGYLADLTDWVGTSTRMYEWVVGIMCYVVGDS